MASGENTSRRLCQIFQKPDSVYDSRIRPCANHRTVRHDSTFLRAMRRSSSRRGKNSNAKPTKSMTCEP